MKVTSIQIAVEVKYEDGTCKVSDYSDSGNGQILSEPWIEFSETPSKPGYESLFTIRWNETEKKVK